MATRRDDTMDDSDDDGGNALTRPAASLTIIASGPKSLMGDSSGAPSSMDEADPIKHVHGLAVKQGFDLGDAVNRGMTREQAAEELLKAAQHGAGDFGMQQIKRAAKMMGVRPPWHPDFDPRYNRKKDPVGFSRRLRETYDDKNS